MTLLLLKLKFDLSTILCVRLELAMFFIDPIILLLIDFTIYLLIFND